MLLLCTRSAVPFRRPVPRLISSNARVRVRLLRVAVSAVLWSFPIAVLRGVFRIRMLSLVEAAADITVSCAVVWQRTKCRLQLELEVELETAKATVRRAIFANRCHRAAATTHPTPCCPLALPLHILQHTLQLALAEVAAPEPEAAVQVPRLRVPGRV